MRSSIYLDKGDYDKGQADAFKAESLGVKIPSKLLEKLEKAKR